MKLLSRLVYLVAIYLALAMALKAESEGPYLHLSGNQDSAGERLPLKSSNAKIQIDGTIAKASLVQTYTNQGNQPIEAIYVFPASTRAAVHGMTLTTGGRTIAARISEKQAAKTEYDQAKAAKKTAALLEEHRPNVFQMSVANVQPGDEIQITVEWTEILQAQDGTYEYVFPTVVGPRYGSTSSEPTWSANPHTAQGTMPPSDLSLDVNLQTTMSLTEISCPSHPVKIDFHSKTTATTKLATRSGEEAANRDFILRWKLGQDRVDAGLMLHQGKQENHFLLQVEPPKFVTPDQIPPRDYLFVLDISGSMQGYPLQIAKKLLTDLTQTLSPDDTFNLLTFAGGNEVLSPMPLHATPSEVTRATEFIDAQQASGGTELGSALKRAMNLPGGDGRSRSIIVITDGFITLDNQVIAQIRSQLGQANLFAFGIGTSVNRHLIEGMARAGQGEPFIITQTSEADAVSKRFSEMVTQPVLAKIRITAEGTQITGLEPSPHADVFANRPLIITGKWSGEPKGKILISGICGNGQPFNQSLDLAEAASRGLNHPALPILWARERVRHLEDEETPWQTQRDQNRSKNPEIIREITSLGLTYSLLTPYTSFIAVDETVHDSNVAAKTVRQPLALPTGVGQSALSSPPIVTQASVPEPGAIGLISLLTVLLMMQRKR